MSVLVSVFLKKGNSLLKRKETPFGFFIVRSNKKEEKKYLRERERERERERDLI